MTTKRPEDIRLEQEARISLLQYYSSKCTSKATSILTIVVAFLAYVEATQNTWKTLDLFWRSIVDSLVISIFFTLAHHQIARLFIWGRLTHYALSTSPIVALDKTLLKRLDEACYIDFKNWRGKKYAYLNRWIAGYNDKATWVCFIIFIVIFCLLFFSFFWLFR
jgi:hypothetical protein